MQKFRFQYQLEGKGLENDSGPSVKLSDKKIQMATKIQDGCQFPPFCRIMPHNFSTMEHKSWVWSLHISLHVSIIK